MGSPTTATSASRVTAPGRNRHGTAPDTSSVNYLAVTNEAVANEVIVKLSPTGSICVFTSAAANVLVDVAGYAAATSDFVSLTPVRLADTRPTPVAAGKFVEVQIAGRGGVPVGAKAVDTVDDVTTAAATNDETTIFMGVMGWGRKGIQRRGCQSQTKADPRRGPVWFVFDVSCCWVCPCVIEILCVWRDLSMFGFCSLSQCVSPQRAVLIYC